jgi:hypothetical protein
MLDLDDNALIALGLREHAQTCDHIAQKYNYGHVNRAAWTARAVRCREIAVRYETASNASKPRNLA